MCVVHWKCWSGRRWEKHCSSCGNAGCTSSKEGSRNECYIGSYGEDLCRPKGHRFQWHFYTRHCRKISNIGIHWSGKMFCVCLYAICIVSLSFLAKSLCGNFNICQASVTSYQMFANAVTVRTDYERVVKLVLVQLTYTMSGVCEHWLWTRSKTSASPAYLHNEWCLGVLNMTHRSV